MSKIGPTMKALVERIAQASTRQGEALREAVQQATLKACRDPRADLSNDARDAVKATTEDGLSRRGKANCRRRRQALLMKAVEGMDAAPGQGGRGQSPGARAVRSIKVQPQRPR